MPRKNIVLPSNTLKILERLGTRIKRARLRRNMGVETIAEIAGISEATVYAIEKGLATVSIGAYTAVLAVLKLDSDIEQIALDEEGKKQFQEQNFQRRERASKRKKEC